MTDQEYVYLRNKILKLTNLDIDCYKSQQMRRRLDMFVTKYHHPTVTAYCSMLEENRDKQRELLDFMAINVSEFYRDAQQFDYLQSEVLPQLLGQSARLNIWSAACSCGQEPYSIAMMLEELSPGYRHRIIASDIDETALERAKAGGPYMASDVKNVKKHLLDKYFVKKDDGYWIHESIIRKITFERHNLLCDRFEQNLDLIICRNVIIYFADQVRDNLFRRFHDSLRPGGVMFLGGSEVMLSPSEYSFYMLHPSFYRKAVAKPVVTRPVSGLSGVLR